MLDYKNIEIALQRFAKVVVAQAKANLTRDKHRVSNTLYNALDDYKINVSKNSIELSFDGFSKTNYADFLDLGVKGRVGIKKGKGDNLQKIKGGQFVIPSPYGYTNKMPPTKVFDKWVIKKGFGNIRNEKGQFITRESLKFAIAKNIYNYGIPQTLFFTKPFQKHFTILETNIMQSFSLDVDNFLNQTISRKNGNK